MMGPAGKRWRKGDSPFFSRSPFFGIYPPCNIVYENPQFFSVNTIERVDYMSVFSISTVALGTAGVAFFPKGRDGAAADTMAEVSTLLLEAE